MEQESNEQEPNEATEIVGGKVETVEVSRHPEASIPETDLSLADIERRRSHPLRWALIILAVLCAIIAPYWFGRSLAVNNTDSIVAVLGGVSPQGIALVGWVAVVITYVGLAMAVVVSPSWPWLIDLHGRYRQGQRTVLAAQVRPRAWPWCRQAAAA